MEKRLIAQGAESKLWKEGDLLIKERVRKSYRIKELDVRLRKFRTNSEARMLKRAAVLINVPKVKEVRDYEIVMEFIDAPTLRDIISNVSDNVISEVGRIIGVLHSHALIHGDLTTSNMLVKEGKVFLIDFGLSEVRDSVEARAVDLHVLKQALESKHYNEFRNAWSLIINSYLKSYARGKEVLERLKIVESRGRYKEKIC